MVKPLLDINYNFLNSSIGSGFAGLNLRQARNEFKMAKIAVNNNQLETSNLKNVLDNKQKTIFESIQILNEQIENSQNSVTYSRSLVDAEKLKFANGESSLFLLNSRENKWLETEIKLVEYKLKYVKAFLELVYLQGAIKYEL